MLVVMSQSPLPHVSAHSLTSHIMRTHTITGTHTRSYTKTHIHIYIIHFTNKKKKKREKKNSSKKKREEKFKTQTKKKGWLLLKGDRGYTLDIQSLYILYTLEILSIYTGYTRAAIEKYKVMNPTPDDHYFVFFVLTVGNRYTHTYQHS